MSDGFLDAFKWLGFPPARASQAEVYAQMDSSGDDEFNLSDFLDDPTVPGTPFDKYKDFYDQFKKQQELEDKCECGSEKTYGKGSNVHSNWCRKAKR